MTKDVMKQSFDFRAMIDSAQDAYPLVTIKIHRELTFICICGFDDVTVTGEDTEFEGMWYTCPQCGRVYAAAWQFVVYTPSGIT